MTLSIGRPPKPCTQLGATLMDGGTHFAVFSENAEAMELCLFSADGQQQVDSAELPINEGGVFSGFVEGVGAGQLYGYRAHGAYDPAAGMRFNPAKLLLDPYARQISGGVKWDAALFGYDTGSPDADLSRSDSDSGPFMPKAVVHDSSYDWEGDEPLRRDWPETVIYETHVRGMTMLHPDVPDDLRGTFAGMASDPVIEHLQRLGVTSVELLPVHFYVDDQYLLDRDLRNYWGYQTLGFFAPQTRYAGNDGVDGFKDMVKRFHKAGLEVILDVVYNHTAEGSELGPTLSFRGLDNASYYVLSPEDARHSFDQTGTGNTLNLAHPMVLRMVLDSLRYWAEEMHVDGFRFDLASTLGREVDGFDREGGFFKAICQDPVLSSLKLIAEPWDIGDGGYQVGGFPHPFREWNDKYRDTVRSFWKGDTGTVGEFAQRVTGSAEQFNHSGRPATASINLLTAHDGFTLMDVVSYSERHNEANGEDGRDGHDNNHSDNMGAEGATEEHGIVAARVRRRRAMVATLLLSQGVPMILSGDEFGNSQQGNNNVYCQDNETGWLDWQNADDGFMDFCARMIALRATHPALSQSEFLSGEPGVNGTADLAWFQPDGRAMDEELWAQAELRVLGVAIDLRNPADGTDAGDPLFMVFNAGDEVTFTLPEEFGGGKWTRVLDTSTDDAFAQEDIDDATVMIAGGSVAAFVPAG